MASKRGIFTGERRGGIELNVTGGRKANVLATMARKAEQTLFNSQKNEVTPFAGHSLTSSSNTSLATSQVSEAQPGMFDGEIMRQIARQQSQRLLKQYMMSRDRSLTEAINTLNSNIDTVQKHFHNALEGKSSELRNEFLRLQEEHEETTNNGLKKLVEVINKRINDLDRRIGDLDKASLKVSFADEMERVVESLHQRIDELQQQKPIDTSMVKRQAQSVVSREIEGNFAKSMREVEGLKKLVQSMGEERLKMGAEVVQLNKTIAELTAKHERSESRVEQLSRRSKDDDVQRQLQRLKQQLQENTSKINRGLEKLESIDLQRMPSSESKELELSNKHSGQVEIALTGTLGTINQPTVTSIIMGSRQPPEPSLGSSVNATSQSIESQLLSREQPREQDQQRSNQIYQLDKDGYLQDEHGQYILDQDNKFIVLNSGQIEALRQSHILLQ